MSILLAVSTAEGKPIEWRQEADLRVHCIADADIDADGANGQGGTKAAYRDDDHGSEALANGGMAIRGGRVVGNSSWWKDIVLVGADGQPLVLSSGVIPSRTAYREKVTQLSGWEGYIDAATIPYIVVPPEVRQRAKGVVLGCKARVTYRGKSVEAMVADIGPRNKAGELSIAAAEAVGIPASPRTGGTDRIEVQYEFWPDTEAVVKGKTYPLIRA